MVDDADDSCVFQTGYRLCTVRMVHQDDIFFGSIFQKRRYFDSGFFENKLRLMVDGSKNSGFRVISQLVQKICICD